MDLESLFDAIGSFAIGLIIVVLALIVCFAIVVIPKVLSQTVPIVLNVAVAAATLIAVIIFFVIAVYLVGKIAKVPLKNMMRGSPSNSLEYNGYCKKCGSKLKNGAKFCESCGEKINR